MGNGQCPPNGNMHHHQPSMHTPHGKILGQSGCIVESCKLSGDTERPIRSGYAYTAIGFYTSFTHTTARSSLIKF